MHRSRYVAFRKRVPSAIIDIPKHITAGIRDIFGKEPAPCLSLNPVAAFSSSSETTRRSPIVDAADSIGLVHNVDIGHGCTILVVNTELTTSRRVRSGIFEAVYFRRLVSYAAETEEV